MQTTAFEQVAPGDLTVDTNVRTTAEIGEGFIESVREHGVLTPIVAHRRDGALHVLMGQRRTLAAVEAGREWIPAYIVDTPEEADRIAAQIVENDQRHRLSDRDRAEAFHQLALLGVAPAKIAKRTGAAKATVAMALDARRNETGSLALAAGLTLEQAATVAGFEDDPEAVERLSEVAASDPGRFEHEARRLTRARDIAAAIAAKRAEAEAEGKTVLADEDQDALPVARLNRPDGDPATEADATAHTVQMRYHDDEPQLVPVVTAWRQKGFTDRWDYGGTGQRSGPMTEEEKAERRRVIENNRAMDAANEVRREWLTALLARKTAPKGHLAFIARTLVGQAEEVAKAATEAARLLGLDTTTAHRPLDARAEAKTRHEFTLLALAIGSYERTIDKSGWRDPRTGHRTYFAQLAEWGYTPSAIEETILPEAAGA